jgi:hypothetical protein
LETKKIRELLKNEKKKSERTVVIGGFAKEASSCRFENGKKVAGF